jgi:hypothetical protein
MKDRDVNFFRPIWRRVAVTAVCVVWAVFELIGHDGTWITITLGLTAYAVWTLFIAFPKDTPPPAPSATAPAADNGGKDAPPSA